MDSNIRQLIKDGPAFRDIQERINAYVADLNAVLETQVSDFNEVISICHLFGNGDDYFAVETDTGYFIICSRHKQKRTQFPVMSDKCRVLVWRYIRDNPDLHSIYGDPKYIIIGILWKNEIIPEYLAMQDTIKYLDSSCFSSSKRNQYEVCRAIRMAINNSILHNEYLEAIQKISEFEEFLVSNDPEIGKDNRFQRFVDFRKRVEGLIK